MDKQLTKDDILRQMFEKGSPFYNQQDIMEAMDIHAKQTSIAYLNWFRNDSIVFFNEDGSMYNSVTDEPISDEQCYELFLQSLNNIQP